MGIIDLSIWVRILYTEISYYFLKFIIHYPLNLKLFESLNTIFTLNLIKFYVVNVFVFKNNFILTKFNNLLLILIYHFIPSLSNFF
jgi:hypothetical protein